MGPQGYGVFTPLKTFAASLDYPVVNISAMKDIPVVISGAAHACLASSHPLSLSVPVALS